MHTENLFRIHFLNGEIKSKKGLSETKTFLVGVKERLEGKSGARRMGICNGGGRRRTPLDH